MGPYFFNCTFCSREQQLILLDGLTVGNSGGHGRPREARARPDVKVTLINCSRQALQHSSHTAHRASHARSALPHLNSCWLPLLLSLPLYFPFLSLSFCILSCLLPLHRSIILPFPLLSLPCLLYFPLLSLSFSISLLSPVFSLSLYFSFLLSFSLYHSPVFSPPPFIHSFPLLSLSFSIYFLLPIPPLSHSLFLSCLLSFQLSSYSLFLSSSSASAVQKMLKLIFVFCCWRTFQHFPEAPLLLGELGQEELGAEAAYLVGRQGSAHA